MQRKIVHSLEPLDDSLFHRIETELDAKVMTLNRNRLGLINENSFHSVECLICRDRDNIEYIVNHSPNLKMLFILSVGIEKLPFELLLRKNILVANPGGINASIMSEYTMGAILQHSTRIRENILNQTRHYWKKFQCVESLNNKRLLIVGAGRTGRLIAQKAKVFGMHCIGIKNNLTVVPNFDDIIGLEQLDDVLGKMDYVVCTIPLTPQTYHLFDYDRFKKMKNTALFINISRGNIIVQADIEKALRERTIGGAVLDVFEKEPLISDDSLWDTPNLLITPHSSGRLEDFMSEAIHYAIENLRAYYDGSPMPNQINLHNGY